eukprot:SAG31_NODE_225_length_19846_cov_19.057983_10_plen_87_part_00
MYEKALTPLAKSMGFATVEECPPGASDLDNAPKSYEHRLSADPAAEATKMRAFNIELEDSTVRQTILCSLVLACITMLRAHRGCLG